MAELIEDQLQSILETDFDDPFRSNSHEHQMISTPKYDQVPTLKLTKLSYLLQVQDQYLKS